MSEAILAEESTLIAFHIWEACIKEVSLGGLFTFRPLQVPVWSGKKKLSTTNQTTITQVNDGNSDGIPLVKTDNTAEVAMVAVK